MFQYIIRRLFLAIPMLLGAMSIVFFAMRILPGDPCIAMMGDEATKEALEDCVNNLGLNRPLIVQYADYMWSSLQFDFGRSLVFRYTVASYILSMFPHTLLLVFSSTFVALLIGLPTGIFFGFKAAKSTGRLQCPDHCAAGALDAGFLVRYFAPHRLFALS